LAGGGTLGCVTLPWITESEGFGDWVTFTEKDGFSRKRDKKRTSGPDDFGGF
jgi:hypothetical protein